MLMRAKGKSSKFGAKFCLSEQSVEIFSHTTALWLMTVLRLCHQFKRTQLERKSKQGHAKRTPHSFDHQLKFHLRLSVLRIFQAFFAS